MASFDAGGAEFQPFLALKFPSVRKGTVVRDVTLSTKLKMVGCLSKDDIEY